MPSRSIYELPFVEDGKPNCYYCLFTPEEGEYDWSLLLGSRLLSQGICSEGDVDNVLDRLRLDLLGNREVQWQKMAIH